jgi:small subunit ribosomal protein S20
LEKTKGVFLPHHKSYIKGLRKSAEQRVHNNALRTLLKRTIKETRAKIEQGEAVDLNQAYADIDHVGAKGIIPKGRAARLKSRLAKAIARKAAKTT